jgi:hypothetical protein
MGCPGGVAPYDKSYQVAWTAEGGRPDAIEMN